MAKLRRKIDMEWTPSEGGVVKRDSIKSDESEMSTKRESLNEALEGLEESVLTMDGLDDALLGLSTRMNEPTVAVYSQSKIIEILVKDGMSYEEAFEHFSFNIAGSYMGAETPTIVDDTMFCEQDTGAY